MEVVQLILEAFIRAPLFFFVPIVLVGFIIWHPWSEQKFYHTPQDADDPNLHESDSKIA